MEFLLIIVGIIVVGFVIYYAYLLEKKRREEMAVLAAELGWSFDPTKDRSHDDENAHFEIFRHGHSRAAYNTLTGTFTVDDRTYPAKMGDFTYKVTSSTGKSTQTRTYRFSYLILHLPFVNVPNLLIRREGMFDKLAGAFGFDDIDFESVEFSKRFFVKSPDKKFAYDVIDPRMMEFLLAEQSPTIDIEYGRCCLSDGKHKWSPLEFKATLNWAGRFIDQWPDHVTASLEKQH
ncbi:MAG: hypothetical protein IH984_08570 [Planctomycetes bacterium]|nr:hypothetical protein [Planctomycetota bacterium]